MSVLVDTSVWVEHFRRGSQLLQQLLSQGEVVVHPFVLGELLLGGVADAAYGYLLKLESVAAVSHEEAVTFVTANQISGTGVGWVDAHLLASSLVAGVTIWSHDKTLAAVATGLGVGH